MIEWENTLNICGDCRHWFHRLHICTFLFIELKLVCHTFSLILFGPWGICIHGGLRSEFVPHIALLNAVIVWQLALWIGCFVLSDNGFSAYFKFGVLILTFSLVVTSSVIVCADWYISLKCDSARAVHIVGHCKHLFLATGIFTVFSTLLSICQNVIYLVGWSSQRFLLWVYVL